jgi:hypothetical protein
MNIRLPATETKGLRVSNEVNLVATRSQFNAKLSSHDAAAAVGGITGDADLHSLPILFGCMRFSCYWTKQRSYWTPPRSAVHRLFANKRGLGNKVPVVDELRSVWLQRPRGKLGEQGISLDVTMSAQSGCDEI